MPRLLVLVLVALAAVLSAAPAAGAAQVVPGEVLVAFEPGAGADDRARVRGLLAADVVRRPRLPGVQVLGLPPGVTPAAAAVALERDPSVRYAEPVYLWKPLAVKPNDSRFWQQANLEAIRAPLAWDYGTGAAGVTVAVIDTGVSFGHNDLAPNEWRNPGETVNNRDDDGNNHVDDVRGWDFADRDADPSGDADPRDDDGHGSHVAGTIGARGNDGYGVAGVTWSAKLMSLRVCDEHGCRTDDQAEAIRYAARNGAKVANMSLGGGGAPSQAVHDALTAASGTLFVVAAGNDGVDNDVTPTWPCNYQHANVVCVAASDNAGNRASFTNYGGSSVDLAAPGVDVVSSAPHQPWYVDTFDDSARFRANWTATAGTWELENGAASDSPGRAYGSDANASLTLNPRSTLGKGHCVLTYDMSTDLETKYDVLSVETSSGGGPWTAVATHTGDRARTLHRVELGPTFSERRDAQLRFRLTSDGSVEQDGVHIHAMDVVCEIDDDHGDTSGFLKMSGTSMASPHVAGVAALLYAAKPSTTVAEVRRALLESVERAPGFAGVSATGGRLDALRAVQRFDTTAPETALGATPPAATRSRDATFTFHSPDPTAAFECSLDGAPFSSCSAAAYRDLALGTHTFRVRALDAAGNRDATPAAWTWTIDQREPDVVITEAPPALTRSAAIRIAFTGDEEGLRYECNLDGVVVAACSSPFEATVREGTHRFTVEAVDAAGNRDGTAATATWSVDATAPDTQLTGLSAGAGEVAVAYSATEAASFECRIDGAPFAACPAGGARFSGLTPGNHTFAVRATDAAGNVDGSPAGRAFRIESAGAARPETAVAEDRRPLTARAAASAGGAARALAALLNRTDVVTLRDAPGIQLPYRTSRAGRLVVELRAGRRLVGRWSRSFARRGSASVLLRVAQSRRPALERGTRLTVKVSFKPRSARTARATRSARLP